MFWKTTTKPCTQGLLEGLISPWASSRPSNAQAMMLLAHCDLAASSNPKTASGAGGEENALMLQMNPRAFLPAWKINSHRLPQLDAIQHKGFYTQRSEFQQVKWGLFQPGYLFLWRKQSCGKATPLQSYMSAILCEDTPETTRVLLLALGICWAASNRSHQLWEADSNWAAPPALLRTRGSKKGLSPRLV